MPAKQGEFAEAMQQMTQGLNLGEAQPSLGATADANRPTTLSSREQEVRGGDLSNLYINLQARVKTIEEDTEAKALEKEALRLNELAAKTDVGGAIMDKLNQQQIGVAQTLREAALNPQKKYIRKASFKDTFTDQQFEAYAGAQRPADAKSKEATEARFSREGRDFVTLELSHWAEFLHEDGKFVDQAKELERNIKIVKDGKDAALQGPAQAKIREITSSADTPELFKWYVLISNELTTGVTGRLGIDFKKFLDLRAEKFRLDARNQKMDPKREKDLQDANDAIGRVVGVSTEQMNKPFGKNQLLLSLLTGEYLGEFKVDPDYPDVDPNFTKADKQAFTYLISMTNLMIRTYDGKGLGRGERIFPAQAQVIVSETARATLLPEVEALDFRTTWGVDPTKRVSFEGEAMPAEQALAKAREAAGGRPLSDAKIKAWLQR